MSRALGWVAIVAVVVLLGTHPDTMAGLFHTFASMLHTAGNQLAAFIGKL
jgi:hypothetical protein